MLFAHEPYYPAPAREVNTSLVAAASLLHPRITQPDGARIHDRLTRGRQPGEIVPLATLTHELNGGADWPDVADWHTVITDLVQLIRSGGCDALSLGLPTIERTLICGGPHTVVKVFDPDTQDFHSYSTQDRQAVLAQVRWHLAWTEAAGPLWPGDGLREETPRTPGRPSAP
ncbi:hypothetical protein [Streptomyces sp. NPDC046197]|uniref:hypothetical protein n=1 Tax=Streptomyces sp. NPDC046197 TaxID=3154337 RepID=UPI0033E94774